MVRRNRSRRKRGRNGGASGSTQPKSIFVNGPFGSSIGIPIGRLPIRLGADRRLSSSNSIYPQVKLDVPIDLNAFGIASGASANVLAVNYQLVNAWSRFSNLFDEYCITGFRFEFRLAVTSAVTTYGGLSFVTNDEKDGNAPTLALMNAPRLDVALNPNETPNHYYMDWKARDVTDLVWTQTGTILTPVWVKCFTGTTSGANSGFSGSIQITGTIAFDFRGYFTT